MKRQIRRGVFETNSSSQHSLCIMKKDEHYTPDEIAKDFYLWDDKETGEKDCEWHIWDHNMEFGRSPFRALSNFHDKWLYACASLVRGDNVMKGYWHREEETKKVLEPDGWLHTGDLAYMDEDRFIYIVDRLKDLIIVNGENIYPGEVEDCIYEVEGVSECAVIGHPDPLRGQVVWAYVVMKEGYDFDENRIRKYLSRNLASYKIPRRFIPMDALPKNASGKILKRALRNK